MQEASIVIVSPALADANNGNWQTARRWQDLLAPHEVRIVKEWPDPAARKAKARPDDVMLALHARRSAGSIAAWAARPAGSHGLAVVLTGTDLYRDIQADAAAQRSLALAAQLVAGCDLWVNLPRPPLEASGTSGMTAAMNGAVNFSTNDGWICEFANHGNNSFIVPPVDYSAMSTPEQDQYDLDQMYEILENQILPLYYDNYQVWRQITHNGMRDVRFQFDSNRMAQEYYDIMYK